MENKQLQQAKDTIAKKYGYEDWKGFEDLCDYAKQSERIIKDTAIEYHRLMSECNCEIKEKNGK